MAAQQTRRLWLISCLIGFSFVWLVSSQPAVAQSGPEIDPAALIGFVDNLIAEQIAAEPIAGVTLSIVYRGEVLLEKGYGMADIEREVPVSSDSIFRIGSITKLFTWISVMQLVEDGVLDLNADIQPYIDFELPTTFDAPITLKHLMTHTAGFEDGTYGLEAVDVEHLKPNGEWLKIHIPKQIYPPGEVSAYSNYGAALAGYIVENQSGRSFEEYVQVNILNPIGMASTSMAQPIPTPLESRLAKPYQANEGGFVEGPFELFHPAPAGSGSASGHDMARLMLTILADGGEILEPETVEMMLSTRFRLDPGVNGYTYGWMEYDQGDERIVGHSGDTAYFHSLMALLPERELGIFVSYNTASVFLQPHDMLNGVLDHLYTIDSAYDVDQTVDLAPYAGQYRLTRHNVSSPEKLMQLALTFTISAEDDRLLVSSLLGDHAYQPVSPTLFHATDSAETLAFELDDQGRPTRAMLGSFPIMLERQAWYETLTFNVIALVILCLLYIETLLMGVVNWLRRLFTGKPAAQAEHRLRWPVYAIIGLTFALLIGFAWPLTDMLAIMQGNVPLYTYIIVIPWLILICSLWLLVETRRLWQTQADIFGFLGRIHVTLFAAAAVFFIWWMAYWQFFAGMPPH